jgi:hypothetical protein
VSSLGKLSVMSFDRRIVWWVFFSSGGLMDGGFGVTSLTESGLSLQKYVPLKDRRSEADVWNSFMEGLRNFGACMCICQF